MNPASSTIAPRPAVLALAAVALAFTAWLPAPASADPAGTMIVPRYNHTATRLPDGRVLVAGGLTQSGPNFVTTATCEIYDPATNSWTATGPLHEARENHDAILLTDGQVLVAGGRVTDALSLKTSEIYNPATGTWLEAGPMLTVRKSPKLALLPDGQVLVAGGNGHEQNAPRLKYCELFNPDTGKWTDTGDLIVGRRSYEMASLDDGRVLLDGGNSDSVAGGFQRKDTETYNPATGTWTKVGDLITGRDQHEQVRLDDGRVLLAGGFVGPASAETVTRICNLFDPTTNVWTQTRALVVPRAFFTANLLPDGNVFAVGGSPDYYTVQSALSSTEEYDPIAGRWHLLASTLEHARFAHTATTLLDGSVLVAGGFADGETVPEAEIFITPK